MHIKQSLGWTLLLFLFLAPLGAASYQSIQQTAPMDSVQNFSAALPHPLDPGKTLLASTDQIFEARSGSKYWKKLTPVRTGIRILRLYHFPQFPDEVFVLADRGLYKFYIENPGSWHSLRESRYGESLTSFAISPAEPGRWYLGSSFHLYESSDEGKTWRISSALSEDPVCFLKFSGDRFYVASEKTLYTSEDLSYFKKVLSLSERVPEDTLPENENSDEEASASLCPFYEIFSQQNLSWTATTYGVFESADYETWKQLPRSGLQSNDVRYLSYDSKTQQLFAATAEGIYTLKENFWKNLYRVSGGENMRGLLLDESQGMLYGITSRGFVSLPLLPDNISAAADGTFPERRLLFQKLVQFEPSAREINHAVARYANTKNSKISRWQAESRLRAFFPSVSFGKDFSDNNNIDLDRGSTSDHDVFIEGPSDISRGWDLNVSWDLGDFIFSTSQTSIDSREKLMVELRHDLTQEATRLYYERRRLQLEAVLIPAPSEQEHYNRLIQIDELTSHLDAMTNNFLSKRLESLRREHPEFETLWEYSGSGTETSQLPAGGINVPARGLTDNHTDTAAL